MQELTDDQLDGLFRKSTEGPEPEFEPADWRALRRQLDARDRQRFLAKLFRWGLPALLLLLTGTVWYVYTHKLRTTQPVAGALRSTNVVPALTLMAGRPAVSKTVRPDRRPRQDQRNAQPLANAEPAHTGTLPAGDPGTMRSVSVRQPLDASARNRPLVSPDNRANNPIGQRRSRQVSGGRVSRLPGPPDEPGVTRSGDVPIAQFAPLEPTPVRSRSAGQPVRSGSRRKNGAGTESVPFAARAARSRPPVSTERFDVAVPTTTAESEPAAPVRFDATDLTLRALRWPTVSMLPAGRNVAARPDTTPARRTVHPPTQTGLSLRFVVSPDLTAIGLRNFDRPGTNVGLLAEYRFGARWSVQAGVMQSTKVYRATSEQYTYPTTWRPPVLPNGITGQCNMLDIPLNLRYDWLLRSRPNGRNRPATLPPDRWFVSGGVTTYVMLREDYTYHYADPTVAPSSWATQTGRYGFSTLNLSAGYERTISRRLSWQVEPFLKVPLRRVGYYKVNLLSTGAFLSIRYKL